MEAELRERSFLPEDPQNCAPHTNKPLETEMCISARCALTQEETIQFTSCLPTQCFPEHKVVGVTDSGVKQTQL